MHVIARIANSMNNFNETTNILEKEGEEEKKEMFHLKIYTYRRIARHSSIYHNWNLNIARSVQQNSSFLKIALEMNESTMKRSIISRKYKHMTFTCETQSSWLCLNHFNYPRRIIRIRLIWALNYNSHSLKAFDRNVCSLKVHLYSFTIDF